MDTPSAERRTAATRRRWPGVAGWAAILIVLAALGLVAWLVFVPREPLEPVAGPMVGKVAPEIADEVEQWVNGEEIDLADLKGKAVLLLFWHPRDGKSPGILGHVQDLAARHAADGLVTIGLCVCDEASEVQPLIREHGLDFPIALDSDGDVHIASYRIDKTGTPYCYLVGRDRRIAWEGTPDALTPRRLRACLGE